MYGKVSKVGGFTSCPFRCDRSQFTGHCMSSCCKVTQSMTIAADSTELLPPTTKITADKAKPKIFP
jgi:hypothetical protein